MESVPVKINNDLSLLYNENTRGINCSEIVRGEESREELAAILNVEKDTLSCKDYWYKYKKEFYYLKKRSCITYILNELLGEYISHYMELPTIIYNLALEDNKVVGLLSKNFRREGKVYKAAAELNFLDSFRIKMTLYSFSKNKELHQLLCRLVVKDYYTCMRDRKCNTLCEKNRSKINIAPLYDYESSFCQDCFSDEYYNPLFKKYKSFESYTEKFDLNKIVELAENDEYFMNQLFKMLDFDMPRCLDNIRDYYKINIPEEVEEYYINFNDTRKDKISKALKKVG